jgi:hypothetical protein
MMLISPVKPNRMSEIRLSTICVPCRHVDNAGLCPAIPMMLALRGEMISRRARQNRKMAGRRRACRTAPHRARALQRSKQPDKDALATFRKPTLF